MRLNESEHHNLKTTLITFIWLSTTLHVANQQNMFEVIKLFWDVDSPGLLVIYKSLS